MSNLKKWTRPNSYIGPNYHGYYCGLGQSRDSDALERSNFRVALERLGGESMCDSDLCDDSCIHAVLHVRDSHWAVGWVEYVLVHESAIDKVKTLSEIKQKLDDYPILDESDFSDEEQNEAQDTIDNCHGQFQCEVLRFIGFKEAVKTLRPKRRGDMDAFISEVFHESMSYSGLENAWVDSKSIKRIVESEYVNDYIKDNVFYKLCKRAA